jgi:hypothetical protein
MKTMNKLMLGCASLVATLSFAQTTTTTTSYPTSTTSIADSPGVLGHSYGEFHYSWVDFNEDNASPRGFIAGLKGNTPVAPGLDVGLGYDYFRENSHRNPFNNSSYDVRSHQLTGSATYFLRSAGFRPFATGGIGYKWSNGDIQSLRTYDDMWLWSVGAGAEIPVGTFAFTPRVTYSNDFHRGYNNAAWHYGAEAHHWFTERVGGFLDATKHDPEAHLADYWTYTAGVRMRF